MILGVHHVLMTAQSPSALATYHQRVFGLAPCHQQLRHSPWYAHVSDQAPGSVMLQAGMNAYIAVAQSSADGSGPPALNQLGLRHICFQNQSIDRLAVEIRKQGGTLFADPLDLGTGNQYAYARDIEHNIYEVEGLPYADQATSPWIGHVAIVVPDLEKAVAFYQGLLRGELRNRLRIGPGEMSDRMSGFAGAILEGAWVYAGNMLIELWEFVHPVSPRNEGAMKSEPEGFSYVAFETDNAETEGRRVAELGGKCAENAIEAEGIVSITASSPDGVELKFVQFLKEAEAWSIDRLDDPHVCGRVDGWNANAKRSA